jgi:hypothetical protein
MKMPSLAQQGLKLLRAVWAEAADTVVQQHLASLPHAVLYAEL